MEFGVLGPLRAVTPDGPVVLPAKQRVVLAALLLRAGRVVPAARLIEVIWADGPPPSARNTLHGHVKRLRQLLGDEGGQRIVTRDPGYLMTVADGELDLDRFTGLCGQARPALAAGDWDEAAARLGQALALWRGEPLADVSSEVLLREEAPRLAELRWRALDARVDAELRLGRHAGLVAELRQLAAADPLGEKVHGQLMLALYRSGRPADALAVFRALDRLLRGELGIGPGPELARLHQRILAADPGLAAAGPPAADPGRPGGPAPAVPRQLPPVVAQFAGRAAELATLTGRLDRAGQDRPEAVMIAVIGGTAGVGKTALAVTWAHQVADRFPDGQLYVNLRGYDPGRPVPPADALAGFLRALGVAGRDIPAEADERAARYRSLLAGRRTLVLLDNAAEAEQVRPLLPGTGTSVAVVTSRDSLAGLVAREGARRLDLGLLPLGDAVGLLAALIGSRAGADPAATAALARQCERLPLALRVAAELAVGRPAASLAGLARELADHQQRLDLLDAAGDPRAGVRAVFSWSYRHLDADAARAFRLLALHPGPDLDPYAVAALTGTSVARARRVLDRLARAYLIQPARPGRHELHDLLRAYARELGSAHDPEDQRRAALTGLFDYYLQTAAAAMDLLFPAERHRRPRVQRPGACVPPLAGPAGARAWLDAERASLAAAAAHMADHGWPGHATRLSSTLFRYLSSGGFYPEAVTIYGHARRAARQAGDRSAEASALTSLGAADAAQGRYHQAVAYLRLGLALFRELSDRTGQARALHNLGFAGWERGRHEQAADDFQAARAMFRELSDRTGEARVTNALGLLAEGQGRYQVAAGHFRQTLTLARETGDTCSEAYALANLGLVDLRLGCHQQAAARLRRALTLFRELGNKNGQALTLARLGLADLGQGRHQQAADQHRAALALSREAGDRSAEVGALNGLGEVLHATGQFSAARAQHSAALGLSSRTGNQHQQARAHHGLARNYHATSDHGPARRHWQEALARYADLGAPEADRVRAHLAAVAAVR